jgi:hypothetical protein
VAGRGWVGTNGEDGVKRLKDEQEGQRGRCLGIAISSPGIAICRFWVAISNTGIAICRFLMAISKSVIAMSKIRSTISKGETRKVLMVSQRADGGGGRAICKIRIPISKGEARKVLMTSQRVEVGGEAVERLGGCTGIFLVMEE